MEMTDAKVVEKKIYEECISFLANGELPFYDLKV